MFGTSFQTVSVQAKSEIPICEGGFGLAWSVNRPKNVWSCPPISPTPMYAQIFGCFYHLFEECFKIF